MRTKNRNSHCLISIFILAIGLDLTACLNTPPHVQSPDEAKHKAEEMRFAQFRTISERDRANEYEYVVTSKQPLTEGAIAGAFQTLSIHTIKSLGNKQFLVRFTVDPGIKNLKMSLKEARIIADVHPNLAYRLKPPGDAL